MRRLQRASALDATQQHVYTGLKPPYGNTQQLPNDMTQLAQCGVGTTVDITNCTTDNLSHLQLSVKQQQQEELHRGPQPAIRPARVAPLACQLQQADSVDPVLVSILPSQVQPVSLVSLAFTATLLLTTTRVRLAQLAAHFQLHIHGSGFTKRGYNSRNKPGAGCQHQPVCLGFPAGCGRTFLHRFHAICLGGCK